MDIDKVSSMIDELFEPMLNYKRNLSEKGDEKMNYLIFKEKLVQPNSGNDAFNGGVKQANKRALSLVRKIFEDMETLETENKSLTKTLEKYNEEMINLRIEKKELIQVLIDAQETINKILEK